MIREITRTQAEAILATGLSDYTPLDIAQITAQAINAGYFNLGGTHYRIVRVMTCTCPEDGNVCAYGLSQSGGMACDIICGRWIRSQSNRQPAEAVI